MLTKEKRNQLILNHLSDADHIALSQFKKTPKCVQLDELKSAAYMGLVRAAQKYQDDKPFLPYASCRIYGEIKDYLRSLCWGGRKDKIKISSCEIEPEAKTKEYKFSDNLPDCIADIDKKVLLYYYVEEFTMKEIGDILNLSPTRIYQIIQKNITLLKKYHA